MTATMQALRFTVTTETGEKTGRAVHIVRDELTGRIRLVTDDLGEAVKVAAALNNDRPLEAASIIEDFLHIEPVQYGPSV